MNKKKVIIIAVAIVVLVCGIIAIIGVHNKANTKEQTITTEQTTQTTEKQTTTEKATTTTTETETETTEQTTVATTEKVNNTTQTKPQITTTKPATPATTKPSTTKEETTKKPAATQSNKNEDLNKLGSKAFGDTARAGKYYDDSGNITTYDKIPEGAYYYYYDSYGDQLYKQKPYSKNNKPSEAPLHVCEDCGKSSQRVNGEPAAAHGGCTQWIKDVTCSCGEFVPAYTCHTCKK